MPIRLKFGLANSINTITAYIMKQLGPHAVVDLAKKIGIQSEILAVPSLCLGTFDLSVYEMVGAYSTFVNKGISILLARNLIGIQKIRIYKILIDSSYSLPKSNGCNSGIKR